MKVVSLELYTRPTCSDCQDAKAFLTKHGISYTEYDLSEQPDKENKLIKVSGARIVPAFVFKDKSPVGFLRKPTVLIGFAQNYDEIIDLLAL